MSPETRRAAQRVLNGRHRGPWALPCSPMAATTHSVHIRLPAGLLAQLKAIAIEQGVSTNTLMTALLAGAVGFTLKPEGQP
jgi:hypothetical protein